MQKLAAPLAADQDSINRILQYDANKKSAGVAYLLWFFFGCFGGHRFYVGKTLSAVIMLLLAIASAITIWIFIGFIGLGILGVWALVDAFLIPGWIRNHNTQLIR